MMTNAEYYLKGETMKKEFIDEFKEKYASNKAEAAVLLLALELFFNDKKKEDKPTLTEDERVILKNLPEFYIKVKRNTWNEVTFVNKYGGYYICTLFNHLFKFIKERRRIRNKGVTR